MVDIVENLEFRHRFRVTKWRVTCTTEILLTNIMETFGGVLLVHENFQFYQIVKSETCRNGKKITYFSCYPNLSPSPWGRSPGPTNPRGSYDCLSWSPRQSLELHTLLYRSRLVTGQRGEWETDMERWTRIPSLLLRIQSHTALRDHGSQSKYFQVLYP